MIKSYIINAEISKSYRRLNLSANIEQKFAYWHGIPREKIPWYPEVDKEKCIGCKLCFVTCGRNVYDYDIKENRPIVENPYHCMVGCSTCATICPSGAITFPDKGMIEQVEREFKVLRIIKKKAMEKKTKIDLEKARKKALETLSKAKRKVYYEITGHIGEREILLKIYGFLNDRPCDIIDIKMVTASLKGCWMEKAPSIMSFNLVSTEYEDVTPCAVGIERILEENEIVLAKKE